MRKEIFKIISVSVFFLVCLSSFAQDGAYSSFTPYSVFGIGNMAKEGTAYTKSMGGVGIATRNRRFINIMNPAAVTARDTLSFMADFGLQQSNTIYHQGSMKSANNTFNIENFVISFPIYKTSAMMVGITPFSNVGYSFSENLTDQDIIGQTGNITYNRYGQGSVYQLFASAGVMFWKRLSLGAEFIYYFGNLDKVNGISYSNSSYRSVITGNEILVRGVTGKFGLQYEQKLGSELSLTLGATYRLRTNMKGHTSDYSYANQSSITDTLKYSETSNYGKVKFGDELGVGLALRSGDRWSVEFDYTRSDWRNTGIDDTPGFSQLAYSGFTSTVSQSFRAGFEIVPNRNDIRYYMRRCAYRGGVYYENSYYKFDGNFVNSMGITLGITLPVFRWYNGISLGVDIGTRGSTRNNMVRENYATFVIGFNIHDLWFQKHRYE